MLCGKSLIVWLHRADESNAKIVSHKKVLWREKIKETVLP